MPSGNTLTPDMGRVNANQIGVNPHELGVSTDFGGAPTSAATTATAILMSANGD
jgi:hypothetical protein